MRAGKFTCPTGNHFDPESMLSPKDVSVDQHQSPSLLCVNLNCCKTDPLRAGHILWLHEQCFVPGGSCSCISCYSPTGTQLALCVQRWQIPHKRAHGCLPLLGLASGWIGAATTAALVRVEDSLIKMLHTSVMFAPRETNWQPSHPA